MFPEPPAYSSNLWCFLLELPANRGLVGRQLVKPPSERCFARALRHESPVDRGNVLTLRLKGPVNGALWSDLGEPPDDGRLRRAHDRKQPSYTTLWRLMLKLPIDGALLLELFAERPDDLLVDSQLVAERPCDGFLGRQQVREGPAQLASVLDSRDEVPFDWFAQKAVDGRLPEVLMFLFL